MNLILLLITNILGAHYYLINLFKKEIFFFRIVGFYSKWERSSISGGGGGGACVAVYV